MSFEIQYDGSGQEVTSPKEANIGRKANNSDRSIKTQVGESHSIDFSVSGEMVHTRTDGLKHDSVKNAPAARSIAETIRTPSGSIPQGAPSDTDTIKIGKMTTSVGSAIRNGFITRNADGSISSPFDDGQAGQSQEAPDSKPEADQSKPEGTPEVFTLDDEGEALMTEIVNTYDQGQVSRAMDEVIVLGEIDEKTIQRIAASSGQDPEAVAGKLNAAHAAFYDSAMARLEDQGVINSEAFEAFLQDNPRVQEETLKAVRSLVTTNDTKGLDAAAEAFRTVADKYLPTETKAALDEAGIPYRQGNDGGLIIKLDGQEMAFSIAVKQGMIGVSPA
ncbi:MAG: hypothetical protein EA407_12990 [Rhodobacteraceae bacterium]|nr:MAG: hypothetical protein EA407_12990 [Paracoccaceae bacterium]